MIAWSLYTTFIGAFLLLLLPRGMARWIALLTAVTGLVISCAAFFGIQNPGTLQDIVRIPWIPALGGMSFHLAADGISLTLIVLTGIIAVTGVLFSWNIELRVNEFFAFYLLLIGSVYGVFLSYDLFLLFVF